MKLIRQLTYCFIFGIISFSICESKNIEKAVFPIIYYSPETSLGLGSGIVLTLRDEESSLSQRPDNISLMASYTFKNQSFIELSPNFYFNNQKGELKTSFSYVNMPTKYFGIGVDGDVDIDDIEDLEEEYSFEGINFEISLYHNVFKDLRFGVKYRIQDIRLFDKETDSRLDSERLTGKDGGIMSGVGAILEWDTRDSIFFPTSGAWYKIEMMFDKEDMDSDFEYERYLIDLRKYLSIRPNHIIALNILASDLKGDIPFYDLNFPLVRGVDGRVFVDRKMVTIQCEYRFPITGRLSGVGFIGLGDVQNDWNDFEFDDIKYGAGGGIRFALNEKEKINLRFDVAISPWGVFPYIMIQEFF